MGKRIGYVAACVVVAHVIASYICIWVVTLRIEELNQRFGAPKYVISSGWKVQAPLRIYTVLYIITRDDVDSGKGTAAMWASYLLPLLLIGGVAATAPRWLFVDEDKSRSMYAGKKRR